jgi:hypothetical protein
MHGFENNKQYSLGIALKPKSEAARYRGKENIPQDRRFDESTTQVDGWPTNTTFKYVE